MLLHFISFSFYLATSIGFRFGPITENATVGTPFLLTWYFDDDEDPDKFYFKQRLNNQSEGNGKMIPFTFSQYHILNGTVPVIFEVPGDHLVEAFKDDSTLPNSTSDKISVSITESMTGSTSSTSSISSEATVSILGQSDTSTFFGTVGSNLGQSSMQPTKILGSHVPSGTVPPSSNLNGDKNVSSMRSLPRILRIVGAAVGGFAFLLILAAVAYNLRRRHLQKKYPTVFYPDRMVRKSPRASLSLLTPTNKDTETYTNSVEIKKHPSCSSHYKENLALSPPPREGHLEYSPPAPLVPRVETPSLTSAYTDRQMEIYDILVRKNTDLLKTELRRGGDVQKEIEELNSVICALEEALASAWALGYTDEIPYEIAKALVPNET